MLNRLIVHVLAILNPSATKNHATYRPAKFTLSLASKPKKSMSPSEPVPEPTGVPTDGPAPGRRRPALLAAAAVVVLLGGVGIGFFIWDAWNSSNLSDIVVALAYIGLVGFALDRLVALAGRLVTRDTTA